MLVLVGHQNMLVLLPYCLLVLAYFLGWRLPRIGPPAVQLLLAMYSCSFILEFCAWLGSYIENDPDPKLLHPQLFPDLILAVGYYLSWWVTWWLALRTFRFTPLEVFITGGLYGVVIEQQGAVLKEGWRTFPGGLLLWLFVFVAYGATMALAVYLVRDSFRASRDHWIKYPLAWAGLFAFTAATCFVWDVLIDWLRIIPDRKLPMRKHPLW
ncbi:MAG: hypothetical protein ACT4QC_24400 [Planctomycetaceae bacterium]